MSRNWLFEEDYMTVLGGGKQAFYKGIVGSWKGTVTTWFEPSAPGIENKISGTISVVPGGNVVRHEYETKVDKTPARGLVLIGKDIETSKDGVAWMDSFHTGGDLMLFRADGREENDGLSVRGSYAAGDQVWHWRTTYAIDWGSLSIRHYNITPDGQEALAVRIDYRKAEPPKSKAKPAAKKVKPSRGTPRSASRTRPAPRGAGSGRRKKAAAARKAR